MQKNSILLPIFILAIAAAGIIILLKYHREKGEDTLPAATAIIPHVSTDIVWNAYSLNGIAFIYPSDWTFDEVKAETKNSGASNKVTGFKVTYPISSNSFDTIEVGGSCPEVTIPEIQNACINGIWMHTQSESPVVLGVFDDMKKFEDSAQTKPL